MLIKRNVYFSAYDEDGEERLYSATEVVDEMDYLESLYSDSDETLDSLKAAGIGGGAAVGLGGAAYGAYKGAPALEKYLGKKRAEAYDKLANRTQEIVRLQLNDKKVRSLEKQIAKAKTAEEKAALETLMKKRMDDVIRSKAEAGFVERTAGKAAKLGAKAGKWVKGHKWPSVGIAAGTVATGTALGYGIHKLNNRNK